MNAVSNAAPLPRVSSADYLAWENTQIERNVFVRGEVFMVSGGTAAHNEAMGAAATTLKQHLKGTRCKTFISDMRLSVEAADCFYYPDVFVTCLPADVDDPKRTTLTGAKLIIEVLSPSTAAFDRGDKFADYRTLETLEEYVLIDPDSKRVDVFRKNSKGVWELHPSSTAAPEVRLESVGWTATVADLLGGE